MNPGIYIHIPFCHTKCGYCDFYSVTDHSDMDDFLNQLHKEIIMYGKTHQPAQPFDTIYIGGGTPSLLSSGQIFSLLELLFKIFNIAEDPEVTLEVNPGTVDCKKLVEFKSSGINRLSIGIQSFNDQELKLLGRSHTTEDSEIFFQMARRLDFRNLSIDLIYAISNQTFLHWEKNLEKAIQLNPEHISAYNLSIEKGTPFYKFAKSGHIKPKPEIAEEQFYNITHNRLINANYIHYEISNFAKSDRYLSRHNFKYWKHIPYLGFGPSAHSFWNNHRWANVRSVKEYISQLNDSKAPIQYEEKLTMQDIIFEHILLHLRTYQGINLHTFKKNFSFSFVNKYEKTVESLLKSHYAILDDSHFKFTHKGMILADEIIPSFAEA